GLGGSRHEVEPRAAAGTRELAHARVGGEDVIEPARQAPGGLSTARAAIPRALASGRQPFEMVEQRLGVRGAVARVVVRAIAEEILVVDRTDFRPLSQEGEGYGGQS